MTKLIEVCDVQYGYPFDSKLFSESDGMPLIRIRDVLRGYSETFTTEDYKPEYVVHQGDILIGMDGEFNIAKWGKIPALLNQRVCRIFPKEKVDSDYIFHALPKALKEIENRTAFVTVKHLSSKEINKITIPIPPLEQQRQIAAILNTLQSIIVHRKQQLAKLDELIKARFVEVEMTHDWKRKYKPEQLCSFLDSITYGFTNPMSDAEEGPWKITAKDVVDGKINFSSARKTSLKEYNDLTDKSKPRKGAVLLTKDGTLGRTAVVEVEQLCVNQSVAVLTPNKRILSQFLNILLQAPAYQNEMIKNSGGGTIKHIYITKVDKMNIVVPSLEEQEEFVAFANKTNKSKVAVQKALDEAQLLFDSLMQEYFG